MRGSFFVRSVFTYAMPPPSRSNTPAHARHAKLTEGPILPSLVTLAVPLVVANVLQAAYQLIDAFWVGRLGGNAVAAVSVSFPVMFLCISLGLGFAIAGSTLIAQYFGAKDHANVDHVASQTILLIALISVFLGIVGYILSPLFLNALGVAPDVYGGALSFMRVSFIGLIFNFVFFMFQSVLRGVGEVKIPVYIVLGTVILNFVLDPLFIFGWGPIPASGVAGAAIATVGTQSIAAIIGIFILVGGKYSVRLHWRDLTPDWVYIKRAFRLGFPASIEGSARALGLIAMTFLITSFGTVSMAAYGVGSNILQVVMIPAIGLSMAIATLVGQNIGARNMERAAKIARLGSIVGFVALEAFGIIVFFTAPFIVRFFVPSDEHVIEAGAIFLRIIAFSWGFIGVQFCLTAVFRASGNMVMTMMLTLISQWVLQFPLAYILSKHTSMGIDGIWWSIPIANTLMGIIVVLIYMKGDWKKKRLIESPQETKLAAETYQGIVVDEPTRA
jgi:putative MATE family efflux protein